MVIESTFEQRCLKIAAPTELSFITASISILLILINVSGNILIILALVLDPNKNLRIPFNWLVVNLAIADLISGIISQPITVSSLIKEGMKKHDIPQEWPILEHITNFISFTASVLSLTSLAVERYLAVRKPNAYRTKVTNKRIVLTIVMIWLISLSLPNIYFYVGFTAHAFIFSNTFLVLAVSIICVSYTLIRRQLNRIAHANSIPSTTTNMSNTHSLNATCETAQSTSAEVMNMDQSSMHKKRNLNTSNTMATRRQFLEARVTKIFGIVLIALLCCYGPSTIMMYFVNFCESCSCITLHWFRDMHFLFLHMHSSINFFCYALRCSTFRNAFAKLLRINRRGNWESSFNLTIF